MTFCSTVMCGNRAYDWNTVLTGRLFGGLSPISSPKILMLPSVGNSSPAIIRSVVVLPQPDGPSSEKNSPSRICRSMSSTASAASPNRLVTPWMPTAQRSSFIGGLRGR